jgi:hypothetical protein
MSVLTRQQDKIPIQNQEKSPPVNPSKNQQQTSIEDHPIAKENAPSSSAVKIKIPAHITASLPMKNIQSSTLTSNTKDLSSLALEHFPSESVDIVSPLQVEFDAAQPPSSPKSNPQHHVDLDIIPEGTRSTNLAATKTKPKPMAKSSVFQSISSTVDNFTFIRSLVLNDHEDKIEKATSQLKRASEAKKKGVMEELIKAQKINTGKTSQTWLHLSARKEPSNSDLDTIKEGRNEQQETAREPDISLSSVESDLQSLGLHETAASSFKYADPQQVEFLFKTGPVCKFKFSHTKFSKHSYPQLAAHYLGLAEHLRFFEGKTLTIWSHQAIASEISLDLEDHETNALRMALSPFRCVTFDSSNLEEVDIVFVRKSDVKEIHKIPGFISDRVLLREKHLRFYAYGGILNASRLKEDVWPTPPRPILVTGRSVYRLKNCHEIGYCAQELIYSSAGVH